MAEGEQLGAELRRGGGPDKHEVSKEADELVEACRRILPNPPTIRGRYCRLSRRCVTLGPRLARQSN